MYRELDNLLSEESTINSWYDDGFIIAQKRTGNIWENIELPRLKNNPNVTKITTIDPKTGIENVIFER